MTPFSYHHPSNHHRLERGGRINDCHFGFLLLFLRIIGQLSPLFLPSIIYPSKKTRASHLFHTHHQSSSLVHCTVWQGFSMAKCGILCETQCIFSFSSRVFSLLFSSLLFLVRNMIVSSDLFLAHIIAFCFMFAMDGIMIT